MLTLRLISSALLLVCLMCFHVSHQLLSVSSEFIYSPVLFLHQCVPVVSMCISPLSVFDYRLCLNISIIYKNIIHLVPFLLP